jgi:pilus assembly protein CpaE
MIRAALFSPAEAVAAELEQSISATSGMTLVRHERRYLQAEELERCLRACSPQLVYVSLTEPGNAIALIRDVQEMLPGVQVIAIDTTLEPDRLLRAMNLGVREFLTSPWTASEFERSVNRLRAILEATPVKPQGTDQVFTFLPAKAGSGTSTVALNAAAAIAGIKGQRVLLADLDLNNGMLGFMFKQETGYSIAQAVARSEDLDEHNWEQVVAKRNNLAMLLPGRLETGQRLEPAKMVRLISFARRLYTTVCLDLSGNMERYAMEAMKESKLIFLVCTPEIPSIHLAQKKLALMRELDLADRVQVILNRTKKDQVMKSSQVASLLRVQISMEFPNDYRGVHAALTRGETVSDRTALGGKFTEFGRKVINEAPQVPAVKSRKFLEMFSVARVASGK